MKRLRRFITHDGGVSAVEFALFSPLLILLLAGIVTGWRYSTQMMEMRTAVKSGANYVLQGGSDLDSAKSAVLMSWASKPDDGAVQVVRQCYLRRRGERLFHGLHRQWRHSQHIRDHHRDRLRRYAALQYVCDGEGAGRSRGKNPCTLEGRPEQYAMTGDAFAPL